MISISIRTAAATRFRSAPAAAGCERELEPEPSAQRDLHCLRGEQGVGVACSGVRTGLGTQERTVGRRQRRQQHVVAEEKVPSVCATQSVATRASIHRARQSRQVGQVGELRAPQAPRKVRPSILQPLAAGVLQRLCAGRRRPTATAGRWRGSRRSPPLRLRRLLEK